MEQPKSQGVNFTFVSNVIFENKRKLKEIKKKHFINNVVFFCVFTCYNPAFILFIYIFVENTCNQTSYWHFAYN